MLQKVNLHWAQRFALQNIDWLNPMQLHLQSAYSQRIQKVWFSCCHLAPYATAIVFALFVFAQTKYRMSSFGYYS